MLYDVAIAGVSANLVFTYDSEFELELGERVVVDLNGRKVKGYVIGKVEFSRKKAKTILERIDGFSFITPADLELAKWLSSQYFSPVGKLLDLFLPSYIDKYLETYVEPATALVGFNRMKINEFLQSKSEDELRKLLKKGYAKLTKYREGFKIPRIATEKRFVTLAENPSDLFDKVKSQLEYEIVNYLMYAKTAKTEQILETFGITIRELQKLTDRNILRFSEIAFSVPDHESLHLEKFQLPADRCMLYGADDLTRLKIISEEIQKVIQNGRSVLYLAPYSSQAVKLAGVANILFESKIAIFHADLTNARKALVWLTAYSGQPCLFFATRIGVFLPIANLGLVVVESEEEGGYYQSVEPVYDAVEAAWKKASLYQVPFISLSSSGRVKSFVKFEKANRYDISLENPKVFVEQLQERKQAISSRLIDLLKECVHKGKGAVLISKRKNYAPHVVCFACGALLKCPNCDISLSYDGTGKALKCHQCGWKEPAKSICPVCGAPALYPVGIGAQRVEKILKYHLPDVNVQIIDLEELESKSLLDTLIKFQSGTIDVLIITQPVAHVLSLPRVGLVAVLDFDGFLNQPDYASIERTIQFVRKMTQVNKDAVIIFQTQNVNKDVILNFVKEKLEKLFESELIRRKSQEYPPFCDLIQIILEASDPNIGWEMIQNLASRIRSAETLGPVEHPLFRIGGKYRYHMILKTKQLEQTLAEISELLKFADKRGFKIFVNPPKLL